MSATLQARSRCSRRSSCWSPAAPKKQELTAPPPPLRPEPEPAPSAPKAVAKDCEPTAPDDELKPISFDERSIPEGARLAEQARAKLKTAESAEVDRLTREQYMTDAVDALHHRAQRRSVQRHARPTASRPRTRGSAASSARSTC